MNMDSAAAKERKQHTEILSPAVHPIHSDRSLLLRRHDAIVARGRVGDRWVCNFHCLSDGLCVDELQPTAGAQGIAVLHRVSLPGDGGEADTQD